MDTRKDGVPAAVSAAVGQGEICLVPGPVGQVYAATHASAVRRFAAGLIQLRFDPLVRVTAPPTVEVVLRRREGQVLVHLLNTTGMQVAGDYATVDYVPPVGPVRVNLGRVKPKSVTLQPENTVLAPVLVQANWVVEIALIRHHSVVAVVL